MATLLPRQNVTAQDRDRATPAPKPDAAGSGKPPYRVIFSNDTTNITTCVSPYRRKGESWTPQMLEATVDEVSGLGVDAHFIQLAHGQVPWYPSEVHPMAEHHRWWQEHFGVDAEHDAFNVGGVHRFILDGGDPLQVFLDRCRQRGQAPFVSMRLNDVHHVENVNTPGNTRGIHSISRFYAEHPEWRIGKDLTSWDERVLNWAVPEVREWVFSLISEQCLKYDIDGFELDFMRHARYFREDETSREQRRQIMLEFVERVRRVLDEGANGKRRWLCARVPCYTSAYDAMGIDLRAWVDAGLDMVNLSPHYFTVQQTDLPQVRESVSDAAVYLEMCHSTWNGKRVAEGYDAFTFRRTTPEQYETAAHAAYSQGADGVSLFNFVYYREHGRGERGPFNEPPFEVIRNLGDPEILATRPQHWFLAPGWKCPYGGVHEPMPREIESGGSAHFELTLAPPTDGWQLGGRLRIQTEEVIGLTRVEASLNGQPLVEAEDRSEPYENPYTPLLGEPSQLRAWRVPPDVLLEGDNVLELTISGTQGDVHVVFIDLAVR